VFGWGSRGRLDREGTPWLIEILIEVVHEDVIGRLIDRAIYNCNMNNIIKLQSQLDNIFNYVPGY